MASYLGSRLCGPSVGSTRCPMAGGGLGAQSAPGVDLAAGLRPCARRDSEDRAVVGNSQGPPGRRPGQWLSSASAHFGFGSDFDAGRLSESLAGRFEPIHITHWSYPEMADAFGFSLDEYVYFGGYSGAAPLAHDQERWRAYIRGALVEPNIERDVLSMTRVDKPALLKRLFEFGALYSGQILSFNKMLGQLQDAGNTTTLTRYLDLLSQAGLLTGLSKHTERPVSAKASIPKLNVLNTALMSAASGYSLDEARADRTFWGRLVESAVGAHLVNTASPSIKVRYWRDGNYEVDFVLQRGPHTVGVEVKSGQAPTGHRGLIEFERRFQPRSTVIVGDTGVALHEFLSEPADYWFET